MLTDSQKWLVLAGLVLTGWLLYLLAPIVTPFLIAALLAYLGDPLVDRLESRRLSRTIATSLVVAVFAIVIVLLPLLLVPVIQKQVSAFMAAVPGFVDWAARELVPWVATNLGAELVLPDIDKVKATLARNFEQVGDVVVEVVTYVSRSGLALAGWLASAVLIPVVVFYGARCRFRGAHAPLAHHFQARGRLRIHSAWPCKSTSTHKSCRSQRDLQPTGYCQYSFKRDVSVTNWVVSINSGIIWWCYWVKCCFFG